MRFSEGAKRYDSETKQRVFEEIMSKAEGENGKKNILSSSGSLTAQKEEDMVMENNRENIRVGGRTKGSIIAAACAVLVVGGSAVGLSKLNARTVQPAAQPVDEVVTDEQETAAKNDAEPKESFREMLERSEYVVEFTVENAELVTVCENGYGSAGLEVDERSASGKAIASYIDYTVSYGDYDIDVPAEDLRGFPLYIKHPETEEYINDINNDVIPDHYMQYAGGPEISIANNTDAVKMAKPGDRILVFADKDGKVNQNLELDNAFELSGKDSVYIFDKEKFQYVSLTDPDENCEELTNFVFDSLCNDEDGYYVLEDWMQDHGYDYELEYVSSFDGEKKSNDDVCGVEWPSEQNGYTAKINVFQAFGDLDDDIRERVEGADVIEFNVHDKGKTTEEFDDYDIELGGLTYDGKSEEYYIFFDVKRKDGTKIEDTVDLSYNDLEELKNITGAENIEAQVSRDSYNGDDLDENIARTGLTLSVDYNIAATDKNTPVTIKINGLKVGDKEIKGQYEVTFNIDFNDAIRDEIEEDLED